MAICKTESEFQPPSIPNENIVRTGQPINGGSFNPFRNIADSFDGILPFGQIPWNTVQDPQTRKALMAANGNMIEGAKRFRLLKKKVDDLEDDIVGPGNQNIAQDDVVNEDEVKDIVHDVVQDYIKGYKGMIPAIITEVHLGYSICDVFGDGYGLEPTEKNVELVTCDTAFWGAGLAVGDVVLVAAVDVPILNVE